MRSRALIIAAAAFAGAVLLAPSRAYAQEGPGAGGPTFFLLQEDVNVEGSPTEQGLTIVMTSENPETAANLKTQMPQRLEWARKLGKVAAERPKELKAPGAPEPFELQILASDEVNVDVAQLDKGVAINIASADPALAAKIREELPKRIEVGRRLTRQFREMRATALQHPRFDEAREMLKHLASGDIKIDLADRDDGLVLTVTSDNPETVKKLQKRAHQGMRKLEELREKAARGELPLPPRGFAPGQPRRQLGLGREEFGLQRRFRQGEPGGPGFGTGYQRYLPREPGREEFAPETRYRGAEPRPDTYGVRRRTIDPELRELIRQEIRRYLEESEE